MTACSRGDVVLVGFVFADETGVKRRPAAVVSADVYHQGRQEAIIAAITSRTDRVLVGDHRITGWREAGPSLHPTNPLLIQTGVSQAHKILDRVLGVVV